MNKNMIRFAVVWFMLFSAVSLRAEDDCGCLSMFNRVVYTNEKLSANTAIQKSYKRVQCSSEYSSHAEAQAAGFELGAEVYGVPLTLGGKFDKNASKQWKKDHCEAEDYKYSSDDQLSFVKQYAPPEFFNSFNTCLNFCADKNRSGISCWADSPTSEHITVAVKWQPFDGAGSPVVNSSLVDGAYNPTLRPGSRDLLPASTILPVGTTMVPLIKSTGKAFVYATIDTSLGDCQVTSRPPAEYDIEFSIGGMIKVGNPLSDTQRQEYSTDSCGTNSDKNRVFCLDGADEVTGYKMSDTCTRFGSGLTNVVKTSATCYTVYGRLKSKGFDAVRACRGTGCWHYNITMTGVKYSKEPLPRATQKVSGLNGTSFSAQYPPQNMPKGGGEVDWSYEAKITEKRGGNKQTIQLSNVNPTAGKYQSRILSDGTVSVWIEE